ncbi:adenosylmethionine--8-amino-7-oxononanoate transaminase [Ilyomonas limi]|uniref:Adenosylmethionine-8-amino-7-oxononanoate aminotransferase n=1 Tax=Ilyomonas limi TaxID=2575867 RepID=A0A4U3L3U8_9BACT|nr:adenosylmethionine--8-amino-7-oxononanoate transaminase [Ilyomonas limi]TKK69851.1 adenosylmethionine--8-amino-7-oxononanoate transaminase [Ilyomonas limi]
MTLAARDKQVIWHPFTPQKNMPSPIAITHGKGTLLFDEQNNSYIDAISSWWVTLHGHAHPYIAERLHQQALRLEQVIFAGFTHEPAVALAERLLQILPSNFSKIFYSDNGSTSTEVALKMAIQYWWNQQSVAGSRLPVSRTKILAFTNAYHGDTFGAMSVSDRSVFTLAFHELLFEVVFIDVPDEHNIENIKTIITQQHENIAAFIYEPLVQGAGGIKMYDATWMNDLLQFVQSKDIICIADEVMTGFGRTGKLFASEYMACTPDIICLSKGLTGGTMALGVTACSNKIYNAYVQDDKLKTFFHGHSFTANPLACTAALASLDLLLKEECLQQIPWIAAQHQHFLQQLYTKKNIKNVRCLGTIIAFEITEGADEYLNNISNVITQQCLQEGIYLRPLGNTVYIMPPYCITAEELNKVYAVINKLVS